MKLLSGTTLLGLAAALAASVTGAAIAHPHEGDGKETVRKIVILDGKGDAKAAGDRIRQFHFRGGKGGAVHCEGEQTKVDETTADGEGGRERTRIVICGDDKLSAADRAAKLEETLARLREREHLGAEHRAKVEAALSEAISRLREAR